MTFNNEDSNAQILRLIIDFSIKSNQFLTTHLLKVLPDVLEQENCSLDNNEIKPLDALSMLKTEKKALNNIDIAYMIILTCRGYKFKKGMADTIFLCEKDAINPDFTDLANDRPQLSQEFEIKTIILKSILESYNKDNQTLITNIRRSLPIFIERAEGVSYSGRKLTINQWIKEKESNGEWIGTEVLRSNSLNIITWAIGNLIILQTRGYYLQEVPALKENEYIFIKA